ncbi:MAG: hypothetical protein ABIZ91_13425 [Gemmatimonadaceae bacterium]
MGLAVGLEREWSGRAATKPNPRFAGVRTLMRLGLVGGVAGWLAPWRRLLLLVSGALAIVFRG